ncbi:MAG: AAA family ATPase, partial [Eggerthellaceae bacterium]|nr:AAA family ATPase [Eggerthellaceae bacterium]
GSYLNPDNTMVQLLLDDLFYVDKTGLASFLNERMGTSRAFVCVSRPRRFGKSADADMLVAYYSRGADSRGQFNNLNVSRDTTFEKHLNAHDVIKLDMTHIASLASGPNGIPDAIARKVASELEAAWPKALSAGYDNLFEALSLVRDSKGSGFVFVIDEWDCIMREAAEDRQAQGSYLDFLRDLLKGRNYVEACYMTGILPIRKYGKQSALNMFTEYTVTDPKTLAGLTGFNEDDVMLLCDRFEMHFDEMAHWYDGYLMGQERIHVYNPRSVAGAIAERQYSSYWTDTETYESLSTYIDMDFDGVATDLVAMLDGAMIPTNVGLFENSMVDVKSKDDVYALLVHLGYLGYDQVERCVFIPNEEIRREFGNAIEAGSRPQLARLVRESRELQRRTIEGDAAYVADAIERAHNSAAGPHYYNDEQALRAAVKLAYIWSIDDYLRIDELPGGRGHADVVFIPKRSSTLPPLVVELKWNHPVAAAIDQIKARNYPAALDGLSGECILVGITYDSETTMHSCQIERMGL